MHHVRIRRGRGASRRPRETIIEAEGYPMSRELAAGRPSRAPTHPGVVLRETVLPALKMPVAEAAGHLGVTRQTLHRILSERASVTPEMAIRIGKFCGNVGRGCGSGCSRPMICGMRPKKLEDEVRRIPLSGMRLRYSRIQAAASSVPLGNLKLRGNQRFSRRDVAPRFYPAMSGVGRSVAACAALVKVAA